MTHKQHNKIHSSAFIITRHFHNVGFYNRYNTEHIALQELNQAGNNKSKLQ